MSPERKLHQNCGNGIEGKSLIGLNYLDQDAFEKGIKTQFFHLAATNRARKNFIGSIQVGDTLVSNQQGIVNEAISYFRDIFKEQHKLRPIFENLGLQKLDDHQAAWLTNDVTDAEITKAVLAREGSKAPAPDGYNFNFIKKAWPLIKDDFIDFVKQFWETRFLPKGVNVALITLIPKVSDACEFKSFRPISMVGYLYKIISKILASRLKHVLPTLIGENQSSFISGRQILDGVLIANEIVDSYKRSGEEAIVLKIDIHKAFEVNWNFIFWIMNEMNFPLKWRKWISACLESASASILL